MEQEHQADLETQVVETEPAEAEREENDAEMADDDYDSNPDGGSPYRPGKKRPIESGSKIRAKLTRGSEPRDKETLLLEGRGEDAAEAAADFEAALQEAEEQEWPERLRAIQPGEGEDDG